MHPSKQHRLVGSRVLRPRPQMLAAPRLAAPRLLPAASAPVGPKHDAHMRFRTDSWHDAKRAKWTDEQLKEWSETHEGIERIRATPPAQPGDTWRIFWHKNDESAPDVLAGYAICCPTCRGIHCWTTASNCHWQETEHSWTDQAGVIHKYKVCGHSGKSSCWTWTNSAEENKLTARASLWAQSPDCGWHGFLTDGILKEC
jgi:hypothetical protein